MNCANIRIKRVYDSPSGTDGRRILVDRLWPRGLSKEAAKVDCWMKEIAPSSMLRKWYQHDPDKWPEFSRRYAVELGSMPDQVAELVDAIKSGVVTLLYSSRETRLNNAVALKQYLCEKVSP